LKIVAYTSQFFDLDDIDGVQEMRAKLLRILLSGASVAGSILYMLAIIPALEEKLYLLFLFYTVFYSALLGLTYIPKIPYLIRVYSWLAILYIFGVNNLLYSGLNVDAGLFFLSFVIMAVLFFDLRRALVAISMSLASIAAVGFLVVKKNYELGIALPQDDVILWAVGTTIFLLMSFMTTITIYALINGLSEKNEQLNKSSLVIEQKSKEIVERELHFRVLVETSPDAIIRFDLKGYIESVNLAGEKLFALSEEEMIGKNVDVFLGAAERKETDRVFREVLDVGVIKDIELVIQNFAGKNIVVEFSIAPIMGANGIAIGLIGVGKDISEKKKGEILLKEKTEAIRDNQERLQSLTQALILAQENERRIISRELHDDTGQVLVTLKHAVSTIIELDDETDSDIQKERLEKVLQLSDQAITKVRSTSHRLRPPALEVGGINVGLETLCAEISSQTGVHIVYRGENIEGIKDDLAIGLYRFAQEALANVLKHANASRIEIKLELGKNEILLSVKDNGQGYKSDSKQQNGTGLLGLQERFAHFSGTIALKTNASEGCSLSVKVPFLSEESEEKY
jgi:PAS domain S-box-containing protein